MRINLIEDSGRLMQVHCPKHSGRSVQWC